MLELLQSLPFADFIRRSTWAFPAIEVVHLTGVALLFGTILVADLTLLRILHSPSLNAAVPSLLVITKTGAVLTIFSGTFLFISDPLELWSNPAFRLKAAALLMAICNAFFFQACLSKQQQSSTGRILRNTSIGISLMLWSAILALGRAIAYV